MSRRCVLPVERWLQQHPWSCGPASLKIVLDTLGLEVEESRLSRLSNAGPMHGAQPEGLRRALHRLRVRYQIVEPGSVGELESRIAERQYCLVDYQAWGDRGRDYRNLDTGHYSVVYGFDATHLLLADPAMKPKRPRVGWGRRRLRKDLFVARWQDREPDGRRTRRWMMAIPRHQPAVRRPVEH